MLKLHGTKEGNAKFPAPKSRHLADKTPFSKHRTGLEY